MVSVASNNDLVVVLAREYLQIILDGERQRSIGC